MPHLVSLLYVILAISGISLAMYLGRVLLDKNRVQGLSALAPLDWAFVGHNDDRLTSTLPQFRSFSNSKGRWGTKSVFAPENSKLRMRAFDYFHRHDNPEGSHRVYGSGFVLERTTSEKSCFKVMRKSKVLSLVPTPGHETQINSNYMLLSESEEQVSEQLVQQLASLLDGVDDVSRIEFCPNAIAIYHRHRLLGKGIPSSVGEWIRRGIKLLTYSRSYAEPAEFWEIQRVGSELAGTIDQY